MDRLDYYCHNNILNILRLRDQLNYLYTCRTFYYKLSIDKVSTVLIKQKHITNYIFRNITSLDVSDRRSITLLDFSKRQITNVSFMKQLKVLNASHYCGIDQNG
jgi:hypothetical protein